MVVSTRARSGTVMLDMILGRAMCKICLFMLVDKLYLFKCVDFFYTVSALEV